MTIGPSLSELLSGALRNTRAEIHVSMPASVVSYDATKQSISAQPLLRRGYLDEDDERAVETLPIISAVPVCFLGGGGYGAPHPLEPGDTVLLVFSDGSLDRWLVKGGLIDPEDDRDHSLSDAVAFPGLRSFPEALDGLPPDAWPFIVPAGKQLRLGGVAADQSAILGDKFKTELTALFTELGALIDAVAPGASTLFDAFATKWTEMLSAKVKVE